MIAQLMVSEMVAAVERERMAEFARNGRMNRMPGSGRNRNRTERARAMVGAFLGQAGRLFERDARTGNATAQMSAVATAFRGTIG